MEQQQKNLMVEQQKYQLIESLVHDIFKGFEVEDPYYFFDGRHTVSYYVNGLNIGMGIRSQTCSMNGNQIDELLWYHNMISRKLRGKYVLLNLQEDEHKIVNNIMRVVAMHYKLPPCTEQKVQFKCESGIERDCMEKLQKVLEQVTRISSEKQTFDIPTIEKVTIDYLLPDISIAIKTISRDKDRHGKKTVTRFREFTGLTLLQIDDFSNYLSVLNKIVHVIAQENRYTATLHHLD